MSDTKSPTEGISAHETPNTPGTAGEDVQKNGDLVSKDAQLGVQRVEGAAAVWEKWHLIVAYALIWLIYFVLSTQEVVVRVYAPFVTSSFAQHSLTATTVVISTIIAGLTKLPLAKILDTWGRPQGLALMMVVWISGFVMMAACENVETYAAAQVFYSVGSQGVSYCLTIFIADTSSLKNRGLMLAFATSPYIVTTWIGGPIADDFIAGAGWRWGLGMWAIVVPVVVTPLCLLLLLNSWKAQKLGIVPARGSGRLTLGSIKRYLIQVDLFGIIILAAGMSLFLLPFNIYSYQTEEWRSPLIICFLVFGVLLIAGFVLYEAYLAPVKFIRVSLLADRTVFFGGLMFTFVFFNAAIWGAFFSSMLLIVWDTSVTEMTYILNIYRVGSCFAALPIGYLIRWSGRFKWVALYYAIPLMILGVGLMIPFRHPDSPIGLVIMTQIFVAFAGGPVVIAGELAMMAPSDHQHIAVIVAILDLFGSIGTALGASVSTAIWTGTFRPALEKYLPPDADIERIYGSVYSQLAYPVGSDIRSGITLAYADAQKYMLVTSVCLLGGALACAAMWRDIKIKDIHQVKGNVV